MTALNKWDDVWIGDHLAIVTHISPLYKDATWGEPKTGREYTIFIEEDD